MKVLVTGASGFLGRAVVAAFAEAGHGVRAMVRPTADVDEWRPEDVDVVRADLRWSGDLGVAFDGVDTLVHLAASVAGDEAEQFASTVVGTERLLESMRDSPARRVILASSFTVYDWRRAHGSISEATPLEPDLVPRGGYTVAKAWQERVARRICDEVGADLTILRPGVIWGRGQACPPGITVRLGSTHLVMGRRAVLPLTYVENCADAFVFAATDPRTVGGTFNVVDDEGTPTWRFVGECLQRSGERGVRVLVPYHAALAVVRAAGWINRAAFDGRARMPSFLHEARFVPRFRALRFESALPALGWRPRFGLDEALDRTFAAGAARP